MDTPEKMRVYLGDLTNKLLNAIEHLKYSYHKILHLPLEMKILNDEELQAWESFSARFSKVVHIYLSRYLRTAVLLEDPGFTGSMRDFINQGEKIGLIDDAEQWLMIRGLRNATVHDYNDSEIQFYFSRIKEQCPRLLLIEARLSP